MARIPAEESRERRDANEKIIDQRSQQIDPAGHYRSDLNESAKRSMKQPGRVKLPEQNKGRKSAG
ncbi:hypothetical protein G0P98_23720 [Yangia sp. PrR004]|nr:hypothetical protein [Salipiger sp. PrR004]